MLALRSGDAVLRSVKLRGAVADRLRARQRLERMLARVDWAPPELPPHAILLVRRLAPYGAGRGCAAEPFDARVTRALRERAQSARRPWLHDDAAAAEAVWFADEAELVACLARDSLRKTAVPPWWWRAVLAGESVADWLRRRALSRGDLIAPAVALLAGRGLAAAWVDGLDARDAARAVAAIGEAFALPAAADALPPQSRAVQDARFGMAAAPPRAMPSSDGPLGRLLDVVPELRRAPDGEPQRRLFALALAVARAPAWSRTGECARAIDRFATDTLPEKAGIDAAMSGEDSAQMFDAGAAARPASTHAVLRASDAAQEASATVAITGPAAGDSLPAHAVAVVNPRTTASARPHAAPGMHDARRVAAPMAEPTAPAHARLADDAARSVRVETGANASAVNVTVTTQFGGVFYLLNAALALGLYGDFTAPRAANLALSPWDWLALAGRTWFGARFTADPVWELLASIAARAPASEPGAEFVPPRAWEVSEDWLEPFGAAAHVALRAGRPRLCVWHPSGFAVLDAPRDGTRRPARQARDFCDARPSLRGAAIARANPAPEGWRIRSPRRRWLHHLFEFLRARLALALDIPPAEATALVCVHPARIACSATHVDVTLSLAALPLAIRMTGLDRDPGWIPAAGRDVRFHFE